MHESASALNGGDRTNRKLVARVRQITAHCRTTHDTIVWYLKVEVLNADGEITVIAMLLLVGNWNIRLFISWISSKLCSYASHATHRLWRSHRTDVRTR